MADPTDTTNVANAATDLTNAGIAAATSATQLSAFRDITDKTSTSFGDLSGVMNSASGFFGKLDVTLGSLGISLKQTGNLTEHLRNQFVLASAGIVSARKSFDTLSNIDTGGLNTFTAQYDELMRTLKPGESLTGKAAEAFTSLATKAGKSNSEIQAAINGGGEALKGFARNAFTSADNALRMQNAVMQMAGATGGLSDVFKMAGPHLENMNALMDVHNRLLGDTTLATGIPREQVEKYWSELGKVPQAMEALVSGTTNSDSKINMLTATMKVAAGTGRSFEDIVTDLNTAFKNYGLVGEGALKFSAQMTEVSGKLGVELATVKSALSETSSRFALFVSEQKGASRAADEFAGIMTNYAAALEKTGLSGTQAVGVVKDMTGQLANLSIAQKAFLSAQSGGPGGLMGGFQIDKMMRDGKMGDVMKMAQQQMGKQFGNIVGLDDATKSQSAAAQREKQLLILQQGPLGAMAKTPEAAGRLLDGLKEMQSGKITGKELNDRIVQASVDKGTDVQSKSFSVMTEMNAGVEAIRSDMNTGFAGLLQREFTAGTGPEVGSTPVKDHLKETMASHTNMGTDKQSGSLSEATKNKQMLAENGKNAAAALNQMGGAMSMVKDTVQGGVNILRKAFLSGDTAEVAKQEASYQDALKRKKQEMSKLPIDKREKAMKEINADEGVLNAIGIYTGGSKSPGSQVGQAANRSVKAGATAQANAGAGAHGIPGHPAPDGGANNVNVTVTGFCLKCKQEIEGGGQSRATNKASNTY